MADGNVRQATGAIEALSIVNLADQATKISAPRTNFPLPRELRDIIYAYLLRHKHVHDHPYNRRTKQQRGSYSEMNDRRDSVSHTYRFHTSILAVNRAIHSEASEALRSNHFIVISHKWNRLGMLKHQHDLSVVTENPNHVARFRLHKLRMHLQVPNSTKLESFIITAEQLPNLCVFPQWLLYLFQTRLSFVTHLYGTASHAFRKDKTPFRENGDDHGSNREGEWLRVPSVKIQLQEHVDVKVAESMLEPFRGVVFGSLKVKITQNDAALQDYARDLEAHMGPRTIWTNAMAWYMVEWLKSRLQQAENLLGHGKICTAGVRYRCIWTLYHACPLVHFDKITYNPDTAEPFGILSSILIMAAIMDTFIEIKIGEICNQGFSDKRLKVILTLHNKVHSLSGPRRTTHLLKALMEWHSILCVFLTKRSSRNLLWALTAIRELASGIHTGKFSNDLLKFVCHDVALIDEWLCGASSVGSRDMLPFTMAEHNTPKPNGLEGYVDMNHLKQIRANDSKLAAELVGDI